MKGYFIFGGCLLNWNCCVWSIEWKHHHNNIVVGINIKINAHRLEYIFKGFIHYPFHLIDRKYSVNAAPKYLLSYICRVEQNGNQNNNFGIET